MPLSKELKAAILTLKSGEKDKLLLRLIGKHADLQEQLQFQLIEGGSTLDERRRALLTRTDRMYMIEPESPAWLMVDMRKVHAEITFHVKITKDKYGEVELLLYLLHGVFEHQLRYIERYNSRTDTLAQYVAKRTEALIKKFRALHPDLQFEFIESLNLLLDRVHRTAPEYYARQMGLPMRV